MKIYSLPEALTAIILDIDRTLYDHDEYADGQISAQYRKLAEHLSVSEGEARARVRAWRDEYARTTGGKTQSLGNTFAALGVPIATSVKWRNETIRPEEHLKWDERLVSALTELAAATRLVAVTNNPVAVGESTLRALGVGDLVSEVIGLDTTLRSKPDTEPFREALRRLGVPPEGVISIGDRYDVDIAPALAVGMGAIQVGSVTDVYDIPTILRERRLIEPVSLD